MLLFLGVPKVLPLERGRRTKHSQETGQETGGYHVFTVKSEPLGMPRLKGRRPGADVRLPSKAPIATESPNLILCRRRLPLKFFDRVGFVGLE